MKNSKKGISLIVLIITIVVIIILAAAVILTINKNNPIESAKDAVIANDKSDLSSAVSMYYYTYMARTEGASPFEANGTFTVSVKSDSNKRTDDVNTVTAATKVPQNLLTWDDIGISDMSSKYTITIDAATMAITIDVK